MSIQSASPSEPSAPTQISSAAYLADYFTTFGFAPKRPAETDPVAASCDFVLTRRTLEGVLEILCIVDRERRPDAQFGYPVDALAAIGEHCLRYTGRIAPTLPAVRIHVIEIGGGVGTPSERGHLLTYAGFFHDAVLIRAWAIDSMSNAVWTNAASFDQFMPLAAVRHAIETPHRTASGLARAVKASRIAQASGKSRVWLTYALITLLFAVYGCELAVAGTKAFFLSATDLAAAGGLSLDLVRSGQWFRVLSAPFLHASPIHLGLNALVLFFAGKLLERTVGTAWFAVVYLVAGLGGALGSLLFNPTYVVTVGASGALMGVVAALAVCSFHFPPGPLRSRMRAMALNVLIPSLFPAFNAGVIGGARIDIAAHVGGALCGAIVGSLVLELWSPIDLLPRHRWVAATIAALGIVAVGLTPIALRGAAQLIPEPDVPISDVGQRYQGAKLAAKYPHDPRARLFHAYGLMDAGNLDAAEGELRAGLADIDNLPSSLEPVIDAMLRTNLAIVLQLRGKTQDAKATAAPVCRSDATDLASSREALTSHQLCD